MQRLAALWGTGQSHQYQSSQQSRAYAAKQGWPYVQSPQTQAPHSQPITSSSNGPISSQASRVAPTSSGVARTVTELLDQIRHMKGFKDVWEVAVKRNGMTTSLALLGGVLFADVLLYRPKNAQGLQAQHLAAPHSSSTPSSSSSSAQQDSSRSSSEPQEVPHRLTHHGAMPAHA